MGTISNKTISELLKKTWQSTPSAEEDSYVERNLYRLYGIKVSELTTEDIRFLINQGVLLEILIPQAFRILEKDLFAEGDFYAGDLLNAVMEVEELFWTHHPDILTTLLRILRSNMDKIKEYDGPRSVRRNIEKFIDRK
uniref:Uncharacterized protein n=2 Tax=unclassified Prevotella TaxID=2638335 RepID=A0AB33J0Q8_9BACT